MDETTRVASEGERAMKNRIFVFLTSVLFVLPLFSSLSAAQESARITVLNPLGQPPPIARVPMAPRPAALEGKTVYIVDIGFTDTHQFFTEMQKLLSEKYPGTNWIVRTKIGTYFDNDPELWSEIKKNGHGMIIGVGH
jgi:hypothetical protein